MLVLILALALLVAGGYAAAVLAAGDKVPRGTSVAGVDIGGLSQDEAERSARGGAGRARETPDRDLGRGCGTGAR